MRINAQSRWQRTGLTLVEATISILIVGTMLVAALNTVGAARSTERRLADRLRGATLARTLLSEILQQAYEDPTAGSTLFGVIPEELGDGSRSLWDDVDDYDGFTESGPRLKSGTAITGFNSWSWSVVVDWADPADPRRDELTDTGVKLIRAVVLHDTTAVCEMSALKTRKTTSATDLDKLLDDVNDLSGDALDLLRLK